MVSFIFGGNSFKKNIDYKSFNINKENDPQNKEITTDTNYEVKEITTDTNYEVKEITENKNDEIKENSVQELSLLDEINDALPFDIEKALTDQFETINKSPELIRKKDSINRNNNNNNPLITL